jgi:hypothetical protein
VTNTRQKGARREKPHMPKPEEQDGMPQHQHCSFTKRREDRNPKYYEEKEKDVASILAAYPLKTVEKVH